MVGMVQKILHITPYSIPNNNYWAKVAVKSNPGIPEVEVPPLGAVSLDGSHPEPSTVHMVGVISIALLSLVRYCMMERRSFKRLNI